MIHVEEGAWYSGVVWGRGNRTYPPLRVCNVKFVCGKVAIDLASSCGKFYAIQDTQVGTETIVRTQPRGLTVNLVVSKAEGSAHEVADRPQPLGALRPRQK